MCVCVCVFNLEQFAVSTDYKGVFNVLIFNDWKILKTKATLHIFIYRDLFVMCKKSMILYINDMFAKINN